MIALHEAGASDQESPAENRRDLHRTKQKERHGNGRSGGYDSGGGKTKAELYEEAKKRGITGRSKMTKTQLEKALHGT